jgi:hypothetical protein
MNRYNSIMPDTQKVDATSNGGAALEGDRPADALTPGSEDIKTDHSRAPEFGGRKSGLDPIRYGDWEKNGRCIDF